MINKAGYDMIIMEYLADHSVRSITFRRNKQTELSERTEFYEHKQ